MSTIDLLAECTAAGISISRDGDDLRIRASRDADLARLATRIRDNKPALHEQLLKQEIMALAHGPTDSFDRERFNTLFAEWKARYGVPWDAPEEQPASALTRIDSVQEGA